MATFVIGDVHGCFSTLEELLVRLELDPDQDDLWLVGDLVNRGPESLATLRWARATAERLGERFVSVLGNHDLHLIAVMRGWSKIRKKDTFTDVLAASDREELVDWLANQPVLHRRGKHLLVHAGLLPEWTADEAESLARRVEHGLRDPDRARRLLRRPGKSKDHRDPLRRALAAFTRLRALTPEGELSRFSGLLEEMPSGCVPWFAHPERRSRDHTIITGHWAALGLRLEQGLFALDSGACWGGPLSAVRLEDGTVFQSRNKELEPVF